MEEEAIQMEEGRSTTIVNLHEQQQPPTITTATTTTSNLISDSLMKKFESLKAADKTNQNNKATTTNQKPSRIQKASILLQRDKNTKYFQPRAVPIGLLHHNSKPHLFKDLKLRLTADFINTHHLYQQTLYTSINSEIRTLRNH